jgi:hypothetical protein
VSIHPSALLTLFTNSSCQVVQDGPEHGRREETRWPARARGWSQGGPVIHKKSDISRLHKPHEYCVVICTFSPRPPASTASERPRLRDYLGMYCLSGLARAVILPCNLPSSFPWPLDTAARLPKGQPTTELRGKGDN